MTSLYNAVGSTNADIIGNDKNPTLAVVNTATGAAFSSKAAQAVSMLVTSSGATGALSVTAQNTGNAIIALGGTAGTDALLSAALSVGFNGVASAATIAPLNIMASTVSQAVLSISGVFVSTASINLSASKTAFIIPVYHETQKVWGYVAASVGVS